MASTSAKEQEEVFLKFADWLELRGATVRDLVMEYDESSGERGVFLTNKAGKGTKILELPLDCLLTSRMAKQETPEARMLWGPEPKFREPKLIALVVHLLATRDKEDHPFKPFYDTLPKDVSHFPIFWNEEQLAWLQGSTAGAVLATRKQRLKKDFDVLKGILPDLFKDVTFTEFMKVRTIVGSRNFYFKDASLIAMVPFADMLNHSVPSHTEWNYNPKKKLFTMSTVRGLAKGDEVFSSYGAKPNLHYFMYYGFAVENNRAYSEHTKRDAPLNKVLNLNLEYDSKDPLAIKRMSVLEKCIVKLMKFKIKRQSVVAMIEKGQKEERDVEIKGTQGEVVRDHKFYSLAMTYARTVREDPSKEVLNFFRVKCATESELDHLAKELKDFNPKKDPDYVEPSLFISPENEASALEELSSFCKLQLANYPEGYKENLKRLKDPEYQDKLRKLALMVVTGEQEVYNFWIAIGDILPKMLRDFGSNRSLLLGALSSTPKESIFELDIHNVALEIARNAGAR